MAEESPSTTHNGAPSRAIIAPTQSSCAADVHDVIVVGTGMGGSTVGFALARLGRRVLFLEKGLLRFGAADRGDGCPCPDAEDSPEARLRRGWWPHPIVGRTDAGCMEIFGTQGCGSGGTSGVYAAQLERFHSADFAPRAHYPDVPGTTLPEAWPITYEDLLPYYREAEALYRVRGTDDPLNPDPESPLLEPPPMSERDQALFDSLGQLGLHPYRAHVAFEFVDGCEECGGVICPRNCKNDAGRICLMPALRQHGAQILDQSEVLRLETSGRAVQKVYCRWRGQTLALSAKVVVLAGGAFFTPRLLLESSSDAYPDGLANSSRLVGRNLMLHTGHFLAIHQREEASKEGPKKSIALNDFYIADGKKLGTVQSVGVDVSWGSVLYHMRSVTKMAPRWWRPLTSPFLRLAARASAAYFRDSAVLATIAEDLPYHENGVVLDRSAKSGFRFEYRYTDELFERNELMRSLIKRALAGRHPTVALSPLKFLNYAHACGTCRFGVDPTKSVLNANNRAHDVDNLYVVDASCFPSSSGTNPSLTIAANALRVGKAIHQYLG
jgi:choline dehydrogenase-like flavoprotein